MTVPVLSEEIYKNPANFEYFIRFKIIGNEDGKKFIFQLRDRNNLRVDYCGKVFKGETLEESINKELFDSFKVEKNIKYSCYEKQESALNRFGEILPRVVVEVIIDKNQIKQGVYNNNSVSWVEIGIDKNSTNLKKMTEYEKELLVLDLYRAGANTILTSEVNIPTLGMKFGMTTVDIPEDNDKKIVNILEKYSKDYGYKFTYTPNLENAMVAMFSWT
jgi:hypothetical protein